jgi:putative ABC transport system permease protein
VILGIPFDNSTKTLYGNWKISGRWPANDRECLIGIDLAGERNLQTGNELFHSLKISGVITTGSEEDHAAILSLATAQAFSGLERKISEAEISALTTPENKLAEKYHLDPKSLTGAESERFFCTPFPTSVASNIQTAIPHSVARVVRRVSESQGKVFTRIQGMVTLLGILGVMACSLSVMGVLTSAVLERRGEVALLQAIGARAGDVLQLFLAEAGLIGLAGGILASGTGLLLGRWLIGAVFNGVAEVHSVLLLMAPLFGLFTALAASAIPIWQTLRQKTAQVLHGN